jgi:hypothetical protein
MQASGHFDTFLPSLTQGKLMNTTLRLVSGAAVIAALSIVAVPTNAHAQSTGFNTAGAKISGDAYWPGRATTRYIESARNYAQEFQTYVAKTPKPEPAVVKEVSKTLASYLDEASKHLVSMKTDFAADKETVAAVESLEKELAIAVARNKAMITCCQDEKFDKAMSMTCCTDLAKQLDKIHTEHVDLMKKLSLKYAVSPATAARK